jgi:hypothetical protein
LNPTFARRLGVFGIKIYVQPADSKSKNGALKFHLAVKIFGKRMKYEANMFEPMSVTTLVKVIFPKSPDFIRDLPTESIHKLVEAGWNTEKTVFLEVPYVMTFFDGLEPASAANHIVIIYEKEAYFRVLTFTRDYIERTAKVDLEDTVLHEQEEMRLCEERNKRGEAPIESVDLAKYVQVKKQEEEREFKLQENTSDRLAKKYGREVVEKEKIKAILQNFDAREKLGVITQEILYFWLWKYLEHNYNKYANSAITTTPAMVKMQMGDKKFLTTLEQNYPAKFTEYVLTYRLI